MTSDTNSTDGNDVRTPSVAFSRPGGLHGADQRAERISQRRVRCGCAVPALPIGKYAVALGDLYAKGLYERRLANSRRPTEQDAFPAGPSCGIHRCSEVGELLPPVDDTAADVE